MTARPHTNCQPFRIEFFTPTSSHNQRIKQKCRTTPHNKEPDSSELSYWQTPFAFSLTLSFETPAAARRSQKGGYLYNYFAPTRNYRNIFLPQRLFLRQTFAYNPFVAKADEWP